MGEVTRIGSDYGGWDIDLSLLPPGSTVISAGIGNDFTFDRYLIDMHGAFVVMADPNQVAIDALAASDLAPGSYRHIPAALWTDDAGVDFGAEHSNGAGIFSSGRSLRIGSVSLGTLFAEYPSTALLKMDIEGAEYEVLEQYDFAVHPAQIAVGFHFSKRPEKSYDTVLDRLRSFGYTVRCKRQEEQSEMVVLLTRAV
jgi:hypothetical protein